MSNNNNYLYSNAFIQQENQDSWDQHFHEQYRQQQFQQAIQDPDSTYYDHFVPYGPQTNGENEPESENEIKNQKFFVKKTTSVVPVSSRDRDYTEFPFPSHFIFFLPKTFHNIEKIELVACSFPNAANVIKGPEDNSLQNNRIFWRNYSDIFSCFYNGLDSSQLEFTYDSTKRGYFFSVPDYYCILPRLDVFIYGCQSQQSSFIGKKTAYYISTDSNYSSTFFIYFSNISVGTPFMASVNMPAPVYSIDIVPGNYTITNLMSQIENQMNQVRRTDEKFHYFQVTESTDTDIITIKSYTLFTLDSNPFSSTLGSYSIVVSQPGHTFLTGDVVLIVGAQTFNGIPSTVLNSEFIISNIIDINSFEIQLTQLPSATGFGGGPNVFTGSIHPFQFIFGPNNRYLDSIYDKSIANNLGFNIENSGVSLNTIDPFSTVSIVIDSFIVSPANPNFSRIFFSNISTSNFKASTVSISNVTNNVLTHSVSSDIPKVESSIFIVLDSLTFLDDLGNVKTIENFQGYIKVVSTGLTTLKVLDLNIISATSGRMKLGTLIKLSKLDLEPDASFKGIQGTGLYFVENVGANYIDIDYHPQYIGDVQNELIYTSMLKVHHPNHNFNVVNITVLSPTIYNLTSPFSNFIPAQSYGCNAISGIDPGTTEFTLLSGVLNFDIGSFQPVYLKETGIGNVFLNRRYLAKITSTTTFTIVFTLASPEIVNAYFTTYSSSISEFKLLTGFPLYALDGAFNTFSSTGDNALRIDNFKTFGGPPITSGIGGPPFVFHTGIANFNTKENEVVFYRTQSNIPSSQRVFGVPLSELNDTYFDVILIDANNYYISLDKYFFEAENNQTFGGSKVFVNSDLHGWDYAQSNTKDWTLNTTLNKGVRLSGDDRVYLTCKGLATVYKKEIEDGFAEIILDQQPGAICFNSFVSEPFIYQNLKDKLSKLEFQVVYETGDIYNFNNLEFSFTLKITEVQKILENETNTGITNEEIYSS